MEADLQKAVDSGKLTSHGAAALAALQPDSYCLHKSWGFGRIESVNFLINQITIDFKGRKGHTMQLEYAAESLQPIPAGHILARKATDLAGLKAAAKDDPAGLVRTTLRSYGGKASPAQINQILVPEVMDEAEFKRWWDTTKKILKKDGHFSVPVKKSEPVELRERAISRSDELLAAFSAARQLKDQLAALDQIIKNLDAFENPPAQLQPVVRAVEDAALKGQRLHTSQAFELTLARDEICEKSATVFPGERSLSLAALIREEERRLNDILPNIPAAKQKRILHEFPRAFGDGWSEKAFTLFPRSSIRLVTDLARLLQEEGRHEEVLREFDRWIREHSASTEILYLICREREGAFASLVHPRVLSAILTALERDQFSEIKRGGKLHDLLLEDRELISDLLANAEPETIRDSIRKLLLTPVFEELNKRSLMGRLIRIYPDMQNMLTGETAEKQEALIVSWESLEKRKIEYEDLITKKIPENTKEIGVARSYGDLRENFEFKAAKEMQRVLMRRKADMEQALSRARGTNFENPDTTQVSIGTVVKLKALERGTQDTYAILGAWDSDPAGGVISYLTAIGQALLGRKAGEQVELPTEIGTEKVEIIEITPYRKNEVLQEEENSPSSQACETAPV